MYNIDFENWDYEEEFERVKYYGKSLIDGSPMIIVPKELWNQVHKELNEVKDGWGDVMEYTEIDIVNDTMLIDKIIKINCSMEFFEKNYRFLKL